MTEPWQEIAHDLAKKHLTVDKNGLFPPACKRIAELEASNAWLAGLVQRLLLRGEDETKPACKRIAEPAEGAP